MLTRILIVDDEPQLARVLRTGLKSHGYEVRDAAVQVVPPGEAENGHAAPQTK